MTSESAQTVVQVGDEKVTLEENQIQDSDYLPSEQIRRKLNTRLQILSNETVPHKTKVCNFSYKVDANKNVIVGNLCDKFENILIQLAYKSGERPLVGNALR